MSNEPSFDSSPTPKDPSSNLPSSNPNSPVSSSGNQGTQTSGGSNPNFRFGGGIRPQASGTKFIFQNQPSPEPSQNPSDAVTSQSDTQINNPSQTTESRSSLAPTSNQPETLTPTKISNQVTPSENTQIDNEPKPEESDLTSNPNLETSFFEDSSHPEFIPHPKDAKDFHKLQEELPKTAKPLSFEAAEIDLDQKDINNRATVELANQLQEKNEQIESLKNNKPALSQTLLWMIGTTIVILIASLAGIVYYFQSELRSVAELSTTSSDQSQSQVSTNPSEVIREIRNIELTNEDSAVVDVSSQATPSVVSVIVMQDTGTSQRGPQLGAGTGFVVSKEGYIVTNRHVVNVNNAMYSVVFADGDALEAEVVDIDPFLDIAFLFVDTQKDLEPLTLGDSDSIQIGQTAIAIGNSLGQFSNSVSKGIISGLGRTILASNEDGTNADQLDDIIQTDASINPGNSGGPLLDIGGNVIGVNVAKSQTGENIGFAIPINAVKPILVSMLENGRIIRPYMGLRFVQVTPEYAEVNELPVNYGIHITSEQGIPAIEPGGPSDQAGLRDNDIIIDIDGQRIDVEVKLQLSYSTIINQETVSKYNICEVRINLVPN
jgi:S1-C subfamily serine protease